MKNKIKKNFKTIYFDQKTDLEIFKIKFDFKTALVMF